MKRDVFQALADPTRRAIVMLLATGAMTPNALAAHFEISRQAVSKHIKLLGECELLAQEKAGREIRYHLNARKLDEVDRWLTQFKQLFKTRFAQLDELLAQTGEKK